MAELANGSKVGGFIIWHQGNDGPGSGLDADLLDGIDSTGFLRRNTDTDTTGKITITRDGDAIVLNKNTTTSYSGITFNSKGNQGSDYAYIRYYDDANNFSATYDVGSGSSENGLLVIGVENDVTSPSADLIALRVGHKLIIDAANIGATGSPANIVEFRNQGTLKSYIDPNGKYMGDVDTLDGLHASQFMRSDTNTSTTGNLSIGGTLGVTGTTTLGALTASGVVKLSKMVYQVTFAPGDTTKTITHNLGTTNYMCTFGANSVARHVAWANKLNNTIDIIIDSPYYDENIVVDVILMAY